MRLFIGNATKQRREWYYRIPGEKLKQMHDKLDIEPGKQVALPYDLSGAQISAMVEAYCSLGFISAKDISRNHHHIGMIYSVDKPVTENALSYTIEANDGKLDEMAVEEMRKNASAPMLNLGQQPFGEPQLQAVDTFVESVPSRDDVNGEQTMTADAVAVSKNNPRSRRRG